MRYQPEYRLALAAELRKNATPSETKLWGELRGRRLGGLKFRRQRPIDRYIADFCCDELKLIVEIDGAVHDQPDQQEYDALRNEYLHLAGYTIVHVSPDDVLQNMTEIARCILSATTICKMKQNSQS
jgi:very-short-patch-repair endonuclease